MALLLRFVVLFGIAASLAAFPACKQEKAPAPQKKSSKPATQDPFPSGDALPTDDPTLADPCSDHDHDDEDDEEDADSDEELDEDEEDELLLTGKGKKSKKAKKNAKSVKRGFSLASTPTYDDDIKPILDKECAACHSGASDPDISTYSKAKAAADQIYDSVKAGRMPMTGKLSSGKIDKIKKWVDAGAPKSADEDEEEDEEEDTSSSSSDCDSSDDEDDDDGEEAGVELDWDELLEPKKLKECHDKGQLYDRKKDECHKAKLATSYECTRSGVIKAFSGIDIKAELDKSEADGYEIDQCGEYEGDPVVFLYKKKETSDTIGLDIRKYCKKNSPACQ